MALRSYAEARPWARSIKDVVASRTMPPWGADPNHSLPFLNERYLDQAEIDTIVAWVDRRCAKGERRRPAVAAQLRGWLDI